MELPGQDGILNLVRQLNHRIDFLTGLLSFPVQLFELFIHSILTTEEGVDLVFLDRETGLDGLFASPVFPVRLSLDEDLTQRSARTVCEYGRVKYLFDLHSSIPAQTDCLRAFRLLESSQVQL